MKVNPITNPNVLRSYQATKPGFDKANVSNRRDEVMLSEEAQSFTKALAEARDAIEFRSVEEQARIAELTNAVRQGQYKVDSNLIAARILDSIEGV